MRVLIVEDADDRIEWFKKFFGEGHTLDITKKTGEAIRWLKENEYDAIFLDHDLAPEHYAILGGGRTEYDEATGHHVACWIAGNPQNCRGSTIIVHSLNIY